MSVDIAIFTCSTVFLVSEFMGLFVSHLIAFNIKTHRGRYYTEQSLRPPMGHWDMRLLPASFARLWGVMHCYSWLVLAGIKAQGLLYFYTLPPPQSPRWNQPWTCDCHWPIEKDRKRERERQKERKPTLLIPMNRPFPFSCKLIQGLDENLKKQAITRAWLVFVLPIIHYNLASVLQTVIRGLTASFPCRNMVCMVVKAKPCF